MEIGATDSDAADPNKRPAAPHHQHGCLKLVRARLKVLLARAEVLEVRQKRLLVALTHTICRKLLSHLSRDGVPPVKSFEVTTVRLQVE